MLSYLLSILPIDRNQRDRNDNIRTGLSCPWLRGTMRRTSRGAAGAACALLAVMLLPLAAIHPVARAGGLTGEAQRVQHILVQAGRFKAELAAGSLLDRTLEARLHSPRYRPTHGDHVRLVAAIETTWVQVAALDREIAATRREGLRVRRLAAAMLPEIAALKVAIRRQLANVRASVVQLYDLSQVSPLEQVLEAKSLTDYLVQQNIVSQIGAADMATLAHARAQRDRLDMVERSYAEMARELSALIDAERAQRVVFGLNASRLNALLALVQRIDRRLAAEAKARRLAAEARSRAVSDKGLPAPGSTAPGTWSTYLVTAYCLTGVTASGAWTRPGTMAATLPFGTRLYVPGYGSGTVQDRGGAIGPGHVDLYMASCSAALQWGAQVIPIEILG